MKTQTFKAEVLAGHKDNAVEVPFDPAIEWGVSPRPLWRGRRGHPVKARVNKLVFESCIVPRQKRFYLLIDAESERALGISPGDEVRVTLAPLYEQVTK